METLNTFEGKLKELFKQAIIEAIEEKKELVRDMLFEVMEDLAMIYAIQKGEKTDTITRDEVFKILESGK